MFGCFKSLCKGLEVGAKPVHAQGACVAGSNDGEQGLSQSSVCPSLLEMPA